MRSSLGFGLALMGLGLLVPAEAANAAGPTQLGVAPAGQVAFSYVGKIEQNGALAVDFGYLTGVAGIDEASLFTGSDSLSRNEASARFTYFASAQLKTRSVNGSVFATSGTAQTTLYLDEQGGASFDDPTSFKRGTAIATWTSVWHDVVNVQQPNMGVATAESDETQASAKAFALGGTQYVLGAAGLLSRLSFTGEGTRTDPTLPTATIRYAGLDTMLAQKGVPTGSAAGSARTPASTYVALGLAAAALIIAVGGVVVGRRRRAAV